METRRNNEEMKERENKKNIKGEKNMKKFIITTLLIASTILTGCASKQQTSSAEVETSDTTKPVITLKGETVNVVVGKEYSAKDNIKSVTDDTDGGLKYAEKVVKDEAYYIVDDKKLDTSKEGTYEVKVSATDKAGNTAEKSFNVVVAKESTDEKKTDSKDASTSKTAESSKKETTTSKSSSEKKTASTSANKKTATSNKSSSSGTNVSSKATTSSSASTSNSGNNNSSSSSSASSSSTATNSQASTQNSTSTQQVHVHDWQAIHQTVHHDEEGKWDKKAQYKTVSVCNGCGQVFYSDAEVTVHAGSVTEEQMLAGCGSTHPEQIVVGYTDEWCKTKDAYDEDVIIGYKCSTCGEIK